MEPKVVLRFLLDSGLFVQTVHPVSEAKRIVKDWTNKSNMRLNSIEDCWGIDLSHVQAIHSIDPSQLQPAPKPVDPLVGKQYPHNFYGPGTSGIN